MMLRAMLSYSIPSVQGRKASLVPVCCIRQKTVYEAVRVDSVFADLGVSFGAAVDVCVVGRALPIRHGLL